MSVGSISRNDAADYLVKEAESKKYTRKIVALSGQ